MESWEVREWTNIRDSISVAYASSYRKSSIGRAFLCDDFLFYNQAIPVILDGLAQRGDVTSVVVPLFEQSDRVACNQLPSEAAPLFHHPQTKHSLIRRLCKNPKGIGRTPSEARRQVRVPVPFDRILNKRLEGNAAGEDLMR